MKRLLHTIAICLLITAVGYVYSIKYDTVYYTEQIAKLQAQIRQEHEYIALAQAEWQYLNNPARIEDFAQRHLNLAPLTVHQIVRFPDLPKRPAQTQDPIGKTITTLGITEGENAHNVSGKNPSVPGMTP